MYIPLFTPMLTAVLSRTLAFQQDNAPSFVPHYDAEESAIYNTLMNNYDSRVLKATNEYYLGKLREYESTVELLNGVAHDAVNRELRAKEALKSLLLKHGVSQSLAEVVLNSIDEV